MTRDGLQIRFYVDLDERLPAPYQFFVRVIMAQVHPNTDTIVHASSLDFYQFRKHYALLCSYLDKSCAQLIFDATRENRGTNADGSSMANSVTQMRTMECCICQERPVDSTLPCCHEFCTVCILQWSEYKQTCPLCRLELSGPEDAWLMTQAPALGAFIDEYASRMGRDL
ncbi:zf-RING 2 domain containing protein [Trichuris trichiura]|uniref:Zf-RING 2 domain containing protein n=1 Tax=Trichuris trichiura TaxID=36087 RepID=A0A077Z6C7_TRITR|nr:zf-RING 2 domain containing protein [Trichuris trichiura]